MRILYYYWGELIAKSAQKVLATKDIEVTVISPTRIKYDNDEEFMAVVKEALKIADGQSIFDMIFSFNYFPDLSRVACECCVQYVAWVYDSPHLTLESVTINNSCNKVYIFDYWLYMKYVEDGISTVNYMPLPARIIKNVVMFKPSYRHDITFIGNLYDGEQDQFGSIGYLPEFVDGYLDSLINSQQYIYGEDLFQKLVNDKIYNSISSYVSIDLGENYRDSGIEIFRNMLRRRVTMNERTEVLKRLGSEFGCDKVDLYCGIDHPNLPVRNNGFADYYEEMPRIFALSKININITLRSIQSGIPLRIMDILGAGGFCITNYQAEIAEYFENGVDIVWYEDIEDLVVKCRYYLEHDEEREAIARSGQKKVEELFEFEKQFRKVLNNSIAET